MTQQIVAPLQLSVSHVAPVPPVVSPVSAMAPSGPPNDEPPEEVAASVAGAEPSSSTAASRAASGAPPASCTAEVPPPNAGRGNVHAFVPLKVTPVTWVAPLAKQSCTSKQLGLLALPLEPNTSVSA